MGRTPRLSAPDTVYHVICRGNNRQKIFMNNRDYFKYLEFWRHYKKELNVTIYAYVLMPNHVHWLLKTGETPLPEIIHRIHSNYARWFNYRHERVGHLFQGRYKSIICKEDSYLLTLARYIHLNPVRAGLTKKVHLYPWSSYHSYSGQGDHLVDTAFLLSYFNQNPDQARLSFINFTHDLSNEEPQQYTYYQYTLPQKEKRQLMPSSNLKQTCNDCVQTGIQNKPKNVISLEYITKWVAESTGITLPELKSNKQSHQHILARGLFIKLAVGEAGIKRSLVAKYLNKDRSTITKVLKK
ncbi:REP element-mobilizing transposase RayT [Desulfoscipio geothermicus DSM 3669]|uniref:REP element-mobilizing transposase RayT n=1 Tax=Desulfoscipio geothermicus DSM 3669 TaxID=1121426 RepID=A0A1I6CYI6_9FIRM|nr:REP element-mobilizing transposase RayT [Desulfoscipio geothermicus DSM 3669]